MRGRGAFAFVAVILAAGYLLFALLAVLPAPTYLLWQLSVLATEAGHLLALVGLLFLLGLRGSRAAKTAAVLGVLGSLLLLTPMLRGARVWRTVGAPATNLAEYAVSLVPSRDDPLAPQRLWFTAADGRTMLPVDVYKPLSRAGRLPLVVVIHGGSWRSGDPTQLTELNSVLARDGFAIAALTYRFAPEFRFPDQLEDVRAALDFLKRRAPTMNVDPSAIVLFGRSAGGQLALLAAYTMRDPAIRGAVAFYAPTDLVWGYEHPAAPRVHDSRAILRDYIGGTPASMPEAFAAASPVTYAAAAPPTLLLHGARDELVNVEHARRLASRLEAADRSFTYIELPWSTHGCDYIFHGPCGQIGRRAVRRFLRDVMNPLRAQRARPVEDALDRIGRSRANE